MKTLIKFSFIRRFINKSNITLQVIVLSVFILLFNIDFILEFINPKMNETIVIDISGLDNDVQSYLQEYRDNNIEYRQDKLQEIKLSFKDKYILKSKYMLDERVYEQTEVLINSYHKKDYLLNSDIEVQRSVESKADDNSFIVFIVINIVYFTLLSTSTNISSEIVGEKFNRILDIILTAIKPSDHFYSKLASGWIILITQSILYLIYFITAVSVRFSIDKGKGFLEFLNDMLILPNNYDSFSGLLKDIDLSPTTVANLILCLTFVVIGMIVVQVVIIVISSYIKNMEEAGSFQALMYMLLMGIYYMSITFNSPSSINEGIPFIMSLLPIVSMLFMPSRILLGGASYMEIGFSMIISIALLYILFTKGVKFYTKGLLNDYSYSKLNKNNR